MQFAKRLDLVQPSATVKVSNQAKEMKRQGIDVINLSIGQPDFLTPKAIDDEAIASIQDGRASFYTAASGINELKQAIKNRIETDLGVTYELNQISVTSGAKMALYAIIQVLIDQDDEVLIPQPSWVSYKQQVFLANGTPVMVPTNEEFKVTVASLDQLVTPNTKLLMINSPQNPTGTVYSREELLAIGNWAVAHNILIVADDIYSKLIYNQTEFTSLIQLGKEIYDHTILVNGVSKAYSMTGWRIGYVAANAEIIKQINTLLSHSTGNPATVSQYAAIAALNGDQAEVDKMREAFESRLDQIYPLINAIPGFTMASKPQGAFYLFVDVTEAIKLLNLADSAELVTKLLTEAHVAVVDGAAFDYPGFIRISYAASLNNLQLAIDRIAKFMDINNR